MPVFPVYLRSLCFCGHFFRFFLLQLITDEPCAPLVCCYCVSLCCFHNNLALFTVFTAFTAPQCLYSPGTPREFSKARVSDVSVRSEERRGGKEGLRLCGCRGGPCL